MSSGIKVAYLLPGDTLMQVANKSIARQSKQHPGSDSLANVLTREEIGGWCLDAKSKEAFIQKSLLLKKKNEQEGGDES